MFNKIKEYKLILINKKDSTVKELNPNRFIFWGTCIIALCLSLSIILISSNDINSFISFKSIQAHKKNNSKLKLVIDQQEDKINNLIIEIDELSKRDDNMRNLLKLPIIDKDIRKLGTGGSNNKDNMLNNLEYLLPGNINLDKLKNSIDFLLRSVNLGKYSYTEIEDRVSIDKNKILHYPAIHPTSKDESKFSSGFGYRYDPFTKKRKLHEGHDFSAKIGTEVFATANGTVKTSRYYGSFGNYIEIDHGNGYVTCYGHLSKRQVKKGDLIERGQIIGNIGNTGRSTAPHLHYEIRYNNKNLDPTNFYFDLSL
tara:strand:- start:93 stop:1028 length:936 start_codon:yes stop_codon:yes gene_type:complete